ncbi:uncharacterized protein EDB91DRAFT_1048632, partial [Suillus paluster]|uniref:uncharacterized protein n=1 Tax=Suillus paluster TaxID=48578 RepID=UPI001B8641A2
HGSLWPSRESSTTFKGDHALAQSIAFIRDALVSPEFAYSVAEGDVGRVYEIRSRHAAAIMLFTFAGSSHSKYTTYLLETVYNIELKCGTDLQLAILKQPLVNVIGKPGSFCAGDVIQEYFNRMLQAIIEREETDYGDTYHMPGEKTIIS